jgi:hypothetical protein
MIQGKFKQIKLAEYLLPVTANHFNKAYLISASLNPEQVFLRPFTTLQATPQIFPNINIKWLNILDTIQLGKVKELSIEDKRHLKPKYRYVYEISTAFYKRDTESIYGIKNGYELTDSFFHINEKEIRNIKISDIPSPISLHPKYKVNYSSTNNLDVSHLIEVMKQIAMAYQITMSMYYEWSIYIKEFDSIGLIIPIEPQLLSDIYKTSILKFEDKKRMLHFVRDHYRRKIANSNEDYSIYIQKYLRGEYKFDYRGFYCEMIPPKYDLNRVKTRKKFIDASGND